MKKDIMVDEGKPAHNTVYEIIAVCRQPKHHIINAVTNWRKDDVTSKYVSDIHLLKQ